MTEERERTIFVCSDSVGETAEAVVHATMRQFDTYSFNIKRVSHLSQEEDIKEVISQADESNAIIAYTLVKPGLQDLMKIESRLRGIRAVDIMEPMMNAFMETFNLTPQRKPGLLHQLDEAYYKRVEAIEFAVNCDDGKDTNRLSQADVILVGVSRTSKTPISMFLAHKGYKVANIPLVPEVYIPDDLFKLASGIIIGLTMSQENMLKIRLERVRSIGLSQDASYSSLTRIKHELHYADAFMRRIRCPIINVTDRAIEETAGIILSYIHQR